MFNFNDEELKTKKELINTINETINIIEGIEKRKETTNNKMAELRRSSSSLDGLKF